MGAGVERPLSSGDTHTIPSTGMRGGLGRTLLTAFLILTTLPLAVIGGYAAEQNRRNLEAEASTRLGAIAALKGEALLQWLAEVQTALSYVMSNDHQPEGAYEERWGVLNEQLSDLTGGIAFGPNQEAMWSVGACPDLEGDLANLSLGSAEVGGDAAIALAPNSIVVATRVASHELWALCFRRTVVDRMLQTDAGLGSSGEIRLAEASRIWPRDSSPDIVLAATADTPVGYYRYENDAGKLLMGAYYPLSGYGVAVAVEQDQAELFASSERIAATLIALVLAVALGSTAIAAVVIRHITRPVIELTESAVAMAKGDLHQRLSVRSRDEIGILTYVFNEMAAELQSLYSDLEAKVVERTERLQKANYQLQRRALHLQASQEVSQAITSVRDPGLLLAQVTKLIRNHFVYSSVAVYLVAPGGGEARLQAASPASQHDVEALPSEMPLWSERLHAGDDSVVGKVLRKGVTQVHNEPAETAPGWYARTLSRVAIPLKMANRLVGVVAVVTAAHEGIQQDELEILEVLANQVTIALENARAYERERQAMAQMEAAEAFKAHFLANMSHELREPLNTIIGFSRLLLKGLDGPVGERQREDLEHIHHDSQHLLFLINDLLAISQLQAGLMELSLQPVALQELIAGVMPTAGALVRGKDIELVQKVPSDLPVVRADPSRLRQVLVHLLNNAAKFTKSGQITLQAWASDGEVYVSIRDTGVGIPLTDRERIFAYFEKGCDLEQRSRNGVGVGLALSKEFVELHGGQIWVDSELGVGSTFTFSVPVYKPQDEIAMGEQQRAAN